MSRTTPSARSSASYTREAGVRNLERELGKTFRKVATKLAAGDARRCRSPSTATTCAATWAASGSPSKRWPRRTAVPGVATGLAVTGTGGDVLFIEATA